jgi:apolipoprotein N-acyltransferase
MIRRSPLPAAVRRPLGRASRTNVLEPCPALVQTTVGERYNSACLLRPDGTASRQDKVELVPLRETLPDWLDYEWIRTKLVRATGVSAPFRSAQDFHLLGFNTQDGRGIRLALSICYEMYFPWLPQFHQQNTADAVIHLTNESWCFQYPSYWPFETWACQYRAIETRSWQLVCTTMGNSAVIDPRGVVRRSLRGDAGVIRTASLRENASAEAQH